jgi:hypothetical protein
MTFEVRSRREFIAGLLFFAIGAIWAADAATYRVGTATAMGPGFFPLVLALVLTVLGAASVIRSLRSLDVEPLGPWPIAALVFVLGGIVAFGLLIEQAGLVLAAASLILLSCWSRVLTRPIETLALAVALVSLVAGIFVYGLGMPFDLY